MAGAAPVPAQEQLVLLAQLKRSGEVRGHGLQRVRVAGQQRRRQREGLLRAAARASSRAPRPGAARSRARARALQDQDTFQGLSRTPGRKQP